MHPTDQMVFEGPFDELVEEVGREQLVYVSAWEMVCKRLREFKLVQADGDSYGEEIVTD